MYSRSALKKTTAGQKIASATSPAAADSPYSKDVLKKTSGVNTGIAKESRSIFEKPTNKPRPESSGSPQTSFKKTSFVANKTAQSIFHEKGPKQPSENVYKKQIGAPSTLSKAGNTSSSPFSKEGVRKTSAKPKENDLIPTNDDVNDRPSPFQKKATTRTSTEGLRKTSAKPKKDDVTPTSGDANDKPSPFQKKTTTSTSREGLRKTSAKPKEDDVTPTSGDANEKSSPFQKKAITSNSSPFSREGLKKTGLKSSNGATPQKETQAPEQTVPKGLTKKTQAFRKPETQSETTSPTGSTKKFGSDGDNKPNGGSPVAGLVPKKLDLKKRFENSAREQPLPQAPVRTRSPVKTRVGANSWQKDLSSDPADPKPSGAQQAPFTQNALKKTPTPGRTRLEAKTGDTPPPAAEDKVSNAFRKNRRSTSVPRGKLPPPQDAGNPYAQVALRKGEQKAPFSNRSNDSDGMQESGNKSGLAKTGKNLNELDRKKDVSEQKDSCLVKTRKSPREKKAPSRGKSEDQLFSQGELAKTGQFDKESSVQGSMMIQLEAVLSKTKNDASIRKQVEAYVERIDKAGGSPHARRLSVRDNDLVAIMTKVAANDPTLKKVHIDGDDRFKNLSPALVVGMAEGIRTNLNLKSLTIRNVELGNDFLSALADGLPSNFILEEIDLSNNVFTSDALVDFCVGLGENESIHSVAITGQNSPIFSHREDVAIEALQANRTIQSCNIEFQSDELSAEVKKILKRNKENPQSIKDYGKKLLEYLDGEAILAEKLAEERQKEVEEREIEEGDWPFLYELTELANRFKLAYENGDVAKDGAETPSSKSTKPPNDSTTLTADGSFLTHEYLSQFIRIDTDQKCVKFDFTNQARLFKRFSVADPARALIVKKFVDVLLSHPQANDFTHVLMANSMCGNDWLSYLCERCLEDPKLLPKLHMINMETNFISGPGVISLAKCIGHPQTWRYLQAVKLENQRQLLSSDAERELSLALCNNLAVITMSLRVRGMLERRQINNYVLRNVDLLRQARRWHAIKTGTLKERARNKIEKFFDKVAANDSSITEVEVVCDNIFLSLDRAEVIKAAKAFENNTHVKKIKMSGLKLDDKFAVQMAKSMENNSTVEKLDLESNAIGSEGMLALVESLGKNRTVTEVLLRHQSKQMSSSDEEKLPALIQDNDVIVKLSFDIRSMGARNSVEKKLRQNQDLRRKRGNN